MSHVSSNMINPSRSLGVPRTPFPVRLAGFDIELGGGLLVDPNLGRVRPLTVSFVVPVFRVIDGLSRVRDVVRVDVVLVWEGATDLERKTEDALVARADEEMHAAGGRDVE